MRKRNKPRRPRSKKRETPNSGPTLPEVTTETTGSTGGPGEVRLIDTHIRQKCKDIRDYIKAGVFSDEQTEAMLKAMGAIVAQGTNREKIAAYKTILARAKLAYDMDRDQEPRKVQHQHGHIHLDAESIGADLAAAAAEIGIEISVEADVRSEGSVLEGQSRGSQQEER